MCRVFVIIPAYNAEHYIVDCLDSLLAQTMPEWRAVVIDDGSRDGTLAVAQSYAARDSRIEARGFPNGGVAAARNRGIGLAPETTEHFLFLDNDDFLNPDSMETLLAALERTPGAVTAYGVPRTVDAEGRPQDDDHWLAWGKTRLEVHEGKLRDVLTDAPTTFASFVILPHIATPGQVLIRGKALRAVKEFDTKTVPMDDWDLWLRLSSLGDFIFLPQFVMNKRAHTGNVSNNGKLMGSAERKIRAKLADPSTLSPELRAIARVGHRIFCAMRFKWAAKDLRDKQPAAAVKQILRGLKSYSLYYRLWSA